MAVRIGGVRKSAKNKEEITLITFLVSSKVRSPEVLCNVVLCNKHVDDDDDDDEVIKGQISPICRSDVANF